MMRSCSRDGNDPVVELLRLVVVAVFFQVVAPALVEAGELGGPVLHHLRIGAGVHCLVVVASGLGHRIEAVLDPLGDAQFAFAGEQFHGAHLTHVHAHGIGGATEFTVHRGEGERSRFCRLLVGGNGIGSNGGIIGVRRGLVDRDAHFIDHADDVLDLLRVHDGIGQMVVHLRVGKEPLFLALGNQIFDSGLRLLLIHISSCGQVDAHKT